MYIYILMIIKAYVSCFVACPDYVFCIISICYCHHGFQQVLETETATPADVIDSILKFFHENIWDQNGIQKILKKHNSIHPMGYMGSTILNILLSSLMNEFQMNFQPFSDCAERSPIFRP